MLFGKKKESGLPVQHYEGIAEFATDYPCRLSLDENMLIIKRIKPETTVTLPVNRIQAISAMEEERFMSKYHGQSRNTSKTAIKKYYLVIEYDKGILAFWGTPKEYAEFVKMQFGSKEAPSTISL